VKVLLDENLDVSLRHELVGHDVRTVTYMRWNGVRNGKLVAAAVADGFEVIVTTDQGMADQLNLHAQPIAIAILHAASNSIDDIVPLIPALLRELNHVTPGTFIHVYS
jgi:predicted nuclease of predicted toxin-antitoxin system